jgi:katanin p60 ATPase-containing subunit A1
MSTIDMSRVQRKLLEDMVATAKEFEGMGALLEAAKAWDRAAGFAESYAKSSQSSEDQTRRLKTAKSFTERAGLLRTQAKTIGNVKENSTDTGGQGFRDLAASLIHHSDVSFDQIAGLETTRNEIMSAFAISLATAPAGVRTPAMGNVLYYGPPGCGKTLLAAALAHSLDAKFYSIKVSDILSKYYGDSPKIVQALYEDARSHPMSIVFVDEFDAVASSRDGMDNSADRRLLVSLLTELDGIQNKQGKNATRSNQVFTIAATNAPWVLDQAILSRFKRSIYIPLPDEAARKQMLKIHLLDRGYRFDGQIGDFLELTVGLSGREIEQMAASAIEHMLVEANPGLATLAQKGLQTVRDYQMKVRAIGPEDMQKARSRTRPVTDSATIHRYTSWQSK